MEVVMIKYLTRHESFNKESPLSRIKGYDGVKQKLENQLSILRHEGCSQKVIPGFVLVGKKDHGRHFMADAFLEAACKKVFVVDGAHVSNAIDELRYFLDGAGRDEAVIIQLDCLDQMKEEQVDIIAGLLRESGKTVYVLGISEEDDDLVKQCRVCGLLEYSIVVTDPFLKDTVQFLEYLIYEKHGGTTFDMSIDDLASVLYTKTFADVDHILEACIREARCSKQKSVSEKQIMNAVIRRYYSVNAVAERLTEKRIRETCIHEIGHAIIAEQLMPGSVGYVSIWTDGSGSPMGSTMIIREDIEFKGCMDEVKVLLGGIAAEEICNGYISLGCGDDISRVINTLTALIGHEACRGLEYIDHYSIRSDVQMRSYDSKVREILFDNYETIKKQISPYKSFIIKIAESDFQEGYVLGDKIRSRLRSG